jgi:putative ABC transport system substrate-binding protein
LRELGYLEGQNILVDYRWGFGQPDRAAGHAADFARSGVEVIVVPGQISAAAAKAVTARIPIVMASGSIDPVDAGLAASLARPGGNVTGLILLSQELTSKRLELLKEIIPGLSWVGVLLPPGDLPNIEPLLRPTEVAARAMGMRIHAFRIHTAKDLDTAFQEASDRRVGAIVALQSPFFADHNVRIAQLALKHRVPVIAAEPGFTEAGGLMTYGPSIPDLWRRAATYVDKILKGTSPAILPIEQPTKFDLALNLKTARALGLSIPESVILRADSVTR